MKQILVNASQKEEIRLAIIENKTLIDLDIELPSKNIKSNIYKGIVSRVEPSLEAAFVDFGRTRHGFLPFKEISDDVFTPGKAKSSRDCIEAGKEIVVQVDREERGNKGAALTNYLTLAGKYIVLLPKNPHTGGISRRLEGEDRINAKRLLNSLEIPDGMSVILRTSALDGSAESLKWDLDYLMQIYESVLENSVLKKAPFLIFQESSMLSRLTRDYVDETIDEILIDDKNFYEKFLTAKSHFIPHIETKIVYHDEPIPLFSKFRIESQLQGVYKRKITLPSGGNVVFDHTEALTSIDVNSAKSTKGTDIEETALNTNLQAATTIANQIKLRDVGGLIVIDFIDMMSINSRKSVMGKMAELAKQDKAKIQFSGISKFGLMEVSRQKLKSSIINANNEICPTCSGSGYIKSLYNLTISIVRILEEEAMKSEGSLTIYLPVRLATNLLNEKRSLIEKIEERQSITIKVIPDPNIDGTDYHIDKEGKGVDEYMEEQKRSKFVNKTTNKFKKGSNNYQEAAVSPILPKTPPPKPSSASKSSSTNKDGLFTRIIRTLFGKNQENETKENKQYKPRRYGRNNSYNRNNPYRMNKYKSNQKRRNYNQKRNKNSSRINSDK